MSAVIEVRTYRSVPGGRARLMEALESRLNQAHHELGMKVLGPFPSAEDENVYVWLRAFPDAGSRETLKDSFYGSPLWLEEHEADLSPLIADFESVLVEDTIDLWDRWPEDLSGDQDRSGNG
ncbi:MAG TPA: NIPSNAP family protein [Acidimicrobiia bacterium]